MTRGNQIIWRKTYPSATSFTTNPILTELELNPGLRGDGSATKHLNHSTVLLPYHERLFQHIYVDVVHVYTAFSIYQLTNYEQMLEKVTYARSFGKELTDRQ